MRSRIGKRAFAAAVAASLMALSCASASGASVGPSLSGKVDAGGRPLAGATVSLYVSQGARVRRLGHATTGARGGFRISYRQPSAVKTPLIGPPQQP